MLYLFEMEKSLIQFQTHLILIVLLLMGQFSSVFLRSWAYKCWHD